MKVASLGVAAVFAVTSVEGAAAAQARATGRVEHATAQRLYLDAGERDGLTPGAVLQLRRGERAASTCRVEIVSETHATCVGAGQVGDTFALSPPPPVPAPAERPSPPSDAEIARRHRVLEAAAHEKVEFRGAAPVSILSGRTEVQFAHATWATRGVGPWHQERLDAAVRGAPVGGGFALYADLSARRWSERSGPISARPDDDFQLYVWEAELVRRPAQEGLTVALGRLRPWLAPGSTVVDGAQAGWRMRGNVEFGLFGGAVPDPATLSISFDRGTVGGYLATQANGDVSSVVRYARQELRIAYTKSPELGSRLEAEGSGQVSLGRLLDLGAQARLAQGDSTSSALDAFSADAGMRPLERLSLLGGFRYQGLSVPERDGPGAARSGGAARHADLTVRWEVVPWLNLAAISGLAKDLTTGMSRQFVGPEVGLPQLLGGVGGASAGFALEGGRSGGHTAWVQLLTRRPRGLQVLARASWFQTRSLGPYTEDELGLYTSISAQLTELIALRLAALGRAGGFPGIRPFSGTGSRFGGTLDAALAGRF
jgi:hypothetical protein